MDLTNAQWRKSSFSDSGNSGGNGGGCIEMAFLTADEVALRDTKDRSLAAHRYPSAEWQAFLAAIRGGEFR